MRKGTALATALLALPICVPAQQSPTPAPPATPAQAAPPRADTSQTLLPASHSMKLFGSLYSTITLCSLRTRPSFKTRRRKSLRIYALIPPCLSIRNFSHSLIPGEFNTTYMDEPGAVRFGIGYLFERGRKRTASLSGRERRDRRNTRSGDGQRTPAHLQPLPAIHQRFARAIHPGPRPAGLRQLSEDSGY